MRRAVALLAPAKINLALAVTAKRADGYHELRSVFATLDLADRVRVAPYRRLEVRIAPDVGAPPGDDLASRAVRAFAGAIGREPAAFVQIRKCIPVAAGLGGGSSDAGAVLRALATIWQRARSMRFAMPSRVAPSPRGCCATTRGTICSAPRGVSARPSPRRARALRSTASPSR